MRAGIYNIEFKRGDNYTLFGRVRTRVWDEATSSYIPGPYRDITGYVGLAQVRATEDASTIIFDFAVTLGDQTAAPGSFYIKAVPSDTKDLTEAQLKGVWDLQWTTNTGEVYTYVEGTVTIDKDTSRV